jgi:hypothetical protein
MTMDDEPGDTTSTYGLDSTRASTNGMACPPAATEVTDVSGRRRT